MIIAVLSDTHFPSHGKAFPDECVRAFERADLIIHAGDFAERLTLSLLRSYGPPVVGVYGNADDDQLREALPEKTVVKAGDLTIGVVHNGGPEAKRIGRLRGRFPKADGVIFGHSHVPYHEVADDGYFILNPGSPTDKRRQPRHSMVQLTIEGSDMNVEFLAVDDPVGPLPPELIRRGPAN